MELNPGAFIFNYRIGLKYQIVRTIGRGTFGITYLANVFDVLEEDSRSTKIVAIKELFIGGINGRDGNRVTVMGDCNLFEDCKTLFLKKSCMFNTYGHPNVVKLLDDFSANGTVYCVMEYIDGITLDERIAEKKGGLSEDEMMKYASQIGAGLSYLHSKGVLHLDVKPGNVMLRGDGSAVLIDFDLSVMSRHADKDEVTDKAIQQGTPGYSPLERPYYESPGRTMLSEAIDVYSFGACIFKMLTGMRPPEAVILLNDGFPEAVFDVLGVSPDIKAVIMKAMSPVRKDRFQSVDEMLAALREAHSKSVVKEGCDEGRRTYKRKVGERQYGTFRIEEVPVIESIDEPYYVRIILWSKARQGVSYELILTDGKFDDGYYSLARSWVNGEGVDEHKFEGGIPQDVKQKLRAGGFLSTTPWEMEESTTPRKQEWGFDVSIEIIDRKGTRLLRRVEFAHPCFHNLLLDAIESLVVETSLNKELQKAYEVLNKSQIKVFTLPHDTLEIEIFSRSPRIGSWFNDELNYNVLINARDGNEMKVARMIAEINALGIEVGPEIVERHDCSETPGYLKLIYRSASQGEGVAYLSAFNTDIQAGNIYNANLGELSMSLKNILHG